MTRARRNMAALLCGLVVLLVVPAIASADVDVSYESDSSGSMRLLIQGDPIAVNDISLSSDADDLIVSDPAEIDAGSPGTGCRQTSSTTVKCAYDASDDFYTDTFLGSANDTFTAAGMTTDPQLLVEGRGGDDHITGSNFADVLAGDYYYDRATLPGDEGSDDRLTAGGGDDLVDLSQFVPSGDDPATSCGSGADVVIRDPQDPTLAALNASGASCEEEAPSFTSDPSISGSPVVGSTLSVGGFAVAGGPDTDISYDWQSCDFSYCYETGDTDAAYSPIDADVDYTIRATVTADVPGGPFGDVSSSEDTDEYGPVVAGAGATVPNVVNTFTLGKFKNGLAGKVKVTVPGPGFLTSGPRTAGGATSTVAATKRALGAQLRAARRGQDGGPVSTAAKSKKKTLVKAAIVDCPAAGTYSVPIRLTSAAKKKLKKGKLKVPVELSYTPDFGTTAFKHKSFTFKKSK